MTYALRDEQLSSGHRLFQPMLDLQTLASALNVSFEIFVKGPQVTSAWKPGDWMLTVSTQFPDRVLKSSSYMPMHALANGINITHLQTTVAATRPQGPTDVAKRRSPAFQCGDDQNRDFDVRQFLRALASWHGA